MLLEVNDLYGFSTYSPALKGDAPTLRDEEDVWLQPLGRSDQASRVPAGSGPGSCFYKAIGSRASTCDAYGVERRAFRKRMSAVTKVRFMRSAKAK